MITIISDYLRGALPTRTQSLYFFLLSSFCFLLILLFMNFQKISNCNFIFYKLMSQQKTENFEEISINQFQKLTTTNFLKAYYKAHSTKMRICGGVFIILLIVNIIVLIRCQIKDKVIYIKEDEKHIVWKGHDHPTPEWKEPTLGCPSQNKKSFNFTKVELKDIYEWEKRMSQLLFKPYSDTNCLIQRYGPPYDGGYLVCQNLFSKSEALINFGIESRDHFGCSISQNHGLVNYQFDCTQDQKSFCQQPGAKNKFFRVCLGDRSEWGEVHNFASLKDIIDSNDLKGKHISIKIDIEGAEWPGFRTLPVSYLDFIDQIIMEVHLPGDGIAHEAYWGNLDIIESLSKNFVAVNLHMNNHACHVWYKTEVNHFLNAFAFEVTLVNKKLIELKTNTRSYNQHPLNAINFDWVNVTCPMHD